MVRRGRERAGRQDVHEAPSLTQLHTVAGVLQAQQSSNHPLNICMNVALQTGHVQVYLRSSHCCPKSNLFSGDYRGLCLREQGLQ